MVKLFVSNSNIITSMRKFLFLFAMLLVVANAWSLPFVPTTDPSASTTKWYQIKTGNRYLYSNRMSENELYVSTTASIDDYYLWCFVGNESTGYTIYNRGAQAYMRMGFFVNGSSGSADLDHIEMGSGNDFYIYYIESSQKMYLCYDTENDVHTNDTKYNSYSVVEVEIDLTPPPYETLTATNYNVPHNTLSNMGEEGYAKLVDQDKTTKWCVVNNSGGWETIWMDFESDVWFIPNGYILTTGGDTQSYPSRNPKEWVLYGKVFKNDDWTELAHVTNGGGLEAKNTTDYTFDITGATQGYRYFRFEVRQINGKGSDSNYTFQLAELQLTGTAVDDPTPQGMPFVPTTDPSASTTKWYQIKTGDSYLFSNSNYKLQVSASPSEDDYYQWCFVGTESTGFKVYNRGCQRYMSQGTWVEGHGNESQINYVEVENGNSFAIYYNNQNKKYYLVYVNNILFVSTNKQNNYSAVEVGAPTPPPTIPGDLNGDGQVDIADVNAVINMMLGKTSPTEAGDVTHDGTVDIADVNAVINIMLGKVAATSTEYTVNGVKFKMIDVEGGTFMMGDGSSYSSSPIHQVTLSDFSIGETEVTQELWQAVMGSKPNAIKEDNPLLPIDYISWYDCQNFITQLNELTGKTFSMPTEAQWEYAARGGKKSRGYLYSGSNNVDDVAWYDGNSSYVIHPVATKAPNELGIYDMSGNVMEWCQDLLLDHYTDEPQTDPTGPTPETSSNYNYRIVRGGDAGWGADFCEACARYWQDVVNSYTYMLNMKGLRLVLGNPLAQ